MAQGGRGEARLWPWQKALAGGTTPRMPKNLSRRIVTYSKGFDGSWGYWVEAAVGAGWGAFGFASKAAARRDYSVEHRVWPKI